MHRDATKPAAYERHGDATLDFVPFPVKTLRCLGGPALRFLADLGLRAAVDSNGSFSCQHLVWGVLRELRVVLCHWTSSIDRTVAGYFALAGCLGLSCLV